MKRLLLLFILHLSFSVSIADTQKPWTFWYWMYGAVSREGIKADLQAMKDVGLGGCYLMPIRGTDEAPANLPQLGEAPAQQLTPKFWEMIDYAMQQADSLGLQMGIHICDGFALAGGPWISPAESMQKVVWTDTIVDIRGNQDMVFLPQPAKGYEGYYEDIAAFAVPVVGEDLPTPAITGSILRDENGTFRSKEPGLILFDYGYPVTVRSVEIIPSGNNIQSQRFVIEASSDDHQFTKVRALTPPRQGWQNTDQNYTYALPETTARYFRFSWTPEGTEPGSEDLDAAKWSPVLKVKDIRLSSEPRIDQYESKNGSVWRQAASSFTPPSTTVYSLPSTRHLPPGKYRILRFGHTSTGHTNATAGGGKGLECDKFSTIAVNKQVDGWFARFMQRPHHEVIRYMHVDSWECGSQNWSSTFPQEFKKRRGYDLLPYMPVYAGIPMDNAEQVLHDIRQTINDLLQDVFFTTVKSRAEGYGVQLSCENVAPTMVSDGMAHFRHADLPMGEYWLNSPTHDKPNDMLDAISGAHIYGKNIVQAEGFTEVRGVWDETPAMIKPLLDRNFCLGMNRLFFHVNTHNPWLDRKPGMTLDGIGLFFQRDQTWFPEAKAFVDYVTRCQYWLQQGRPVTDIAVYTGEEMPHRAFTPDRLVSMLPGLFGSERVVSEQQRIANTGCPMEESPVGVRHNAGIFDLKDWVNPLHGYQYDSMNPDALLSQPFPYKVFVIPESCLVGNAAKARMEVLRQQGVIIIDSPYFGDSIKGVARDVVLPDGIAYCHRVTETDHIYFLANQTGESRTFTPRFRDTNSTLPIVYAPLTDAYHPFPADGALTLRPYESTFVIFSNSQRFPMSYGIPVTTCLHQRMPSSKFVWKHKGNWTIHFKESGIALQTDTLFDWSRYPADSIRYYSGHARYVTSFIYKGKNNKTLLALGDVRDVAHVWVNGHDCGILWMAPFEADVSHALQKGRNTVEIEVVNTWHNALRGADAGKPPYDGIWTNAKYRTKGNDLLPAGLLGPVNLIIKQ